MKQLLKINLFKVVLFSSFSILLFNSCSEKDDNNGDVRIYEFTEKIGKKIKELSDFQSSVVFGVYKGTYPEESRKILESAQDKLKNLLQSIREESIKPTEIAEEIRKLFDEIDVMVEDFKTTIRIEDYIPEKVELSVKGKEGGYIDFGHHPEYSHFGEKGKQEFTIEFWVKITEPDFQNDFVFLLSTFTDDDANDHERKGWCVNNHMGNMRITYSMGFNDLMEPAYKFDSLNEWVHLAFVTNEAGIGGEMNSGRPIMTKMYLNGELKLSTISNHSEDKPYTPNDKEIPMVAFTAMSVDGSPMFEKSTNGCIKHLHFWKTEKRQDQIKEIMNNPENVIGTEPDLICGWDFTVLSAEGEPIPDLTGKYSARLVGKCEWVEVK